MLENTKNILIIIVVFIFLIKSCQMIIDFQNTDIENFTQKNDIITKNLYPNYDKLLNNIKKLKMENKYSIDLLSTNPPIFTVSNFLSKKESDELIHLFKFFSDSENNINRNNVKLNNYQRNDTIKKVISKISELILVPSNNSDAPSITKITNKNFKKETIYDSIIYNESNFITPQKIFSIKAFLNNFEGGEIKLEGIDKTIKSEKGKIIVICNCQNGTKIRHDSSNYTKLPVKSGNEYLFNLTFNDYSKEYVELEKMKENDYKKGLKAYQVFKEEADKKYNEILKETEEEFVRIMKEGFKIRDQYGIDDSKEIQILMENTKKIRNKFKK